jgi:SNF2 family DNA or RNA helicase
MRRSSRLSGGSDADREWPGHVLTQIHRQLLLDCGIGLPAADKLGPQADEYSQHRVLIFCQLRPMLDLIERDLFADGRLDRRPKASRGGPDVQQ